MAVETVAIDSGDIHTSRWWDLRNLSTTPLRHLTKVALQTKCYSLIEPSGHDAMMVTSDSALRHESLRPVESESMYARRCTACDGTKQMVN